MKKLSKHIDHEYYFGSFWYLFITIILFSCKDDITNKRYRNENYVFYQEDGKEGEWRKIDPLKEPDLPKSLSTYFFPNGSKYAELEILDSFPNRIVKYYDFSERLTHTNKYSLDSLIETRFFDGYYYGYYSNLGLLEAEGLIKNGLNQGKWKFYWKDGKTLKQIVKYANDTVNGIREDYWDNGNLKSKVYKINGVLNGECFHYYKNGQLEEHSFWKDGKFNGKSVRYHKNGVVQAKCQYWNDIAIDTCKFYYNDGVLKGIEINQIDTVTNKLSKIVANYYQNGKLKQSFKKINEHYDGPIKVYYKNGKLSHEITFIDGKREGFSYEFFENGGIKYKALYVNDLIEGEMQEFDKNGKLIKTHIAENGEKVDIIIH